MTKAWAHTSEAAAGVFGWSFEPLVSVPLAVVAVLYIAGSGQLSRRGKADRRREQVWFWLGFASLAFALCSPLHALGTRIFAAHMVERSLPW
jgi:putative membrane protein